MGSLKGFLVMLELMPKNQFALMSGAAEVQLFTRHGIVGCKNGPEATVCLPITFLLVGKGIQGLPTASSTLGLRASVKAVAF